MATKIRLQRHGKKGNAFYHIVVADSKAPRDGKFIEKIGIYNPNTNPASIDITFDRAVYWMQVGAQPTDTTRAILSYKGVLYKNHLLNGVKKGALTEDQVEERFTKWLDEKEGKITTKSESLVKAVEKEKADRLKAEVEVKEAKAKSIQAKNAPEVEEPVAEEVVEEIETPATEANEETPAAEGTEEAPAAEETPAVEAAQADEEAEKSAE